jgi:tRNA (mo5U34)-methyltransferase
MTPLFDEVRFGAGSFGEKIAKIRASAKVAFPWYPYKTMSNFELITRVMPERYDHLFKKPKKIADIGGADGEVALYLSGLGYECDLYDYGPTNMNGLRGARYLKEALGSSARIFEVDLDSQFSLQETSYDLILFLGLLYHLKNPFYALERMAKHSRYMFVSTRIARHFKAGTEDVSNIPAAYLLAPDESNNDSTNYWIFTKAGFERLIERTGWNLVASSSSGIPHSNPQDDRLDERVYALLEAR